MLAKNKTGNTFSWTDKYSFSSKHSLQGPVNSEHFKILLFCDMLLSFGQSFFVSRVLNLAIFFKSRALVLEKKEFCNILIIIPFPGGGGGGILYRYVLP